MNSIKQKKILHLIDTTGCGGAEKVLLYIVSNLDRGYTSLIILPDKGWLYKKIIQLPKIEVYVINGSGRMNLLYIYKLVRFIFKNKIDIVHSHLLGTSLYACIAGTICRKPIFCTFHGFIDADLQDPLLKFKFLIIRSGAKKIIAVSDHLSNYIEKIIGQKIKKCTTIYNGIPFATNTIETANSLCKKQQVEASEHEIIIGSVGNVKHAKGYEYLIKAAKLVNTINPKCKFIIAGRTEGNLFDELIALRNKLELTDTVNFIGYREDVDQVYGMLDIFILPSITEGFSLTTIEAMVHGVPVIVTKSGGPEEIVEHNFSGLLVNTADEHALAEAIQFFIDNPARTKLFTANARQTVIDNFSITSMMNAYEKLYQLN